MWKWFAGSSGPSVIFICETVVLFVDAGNVLGTCFLDDGWVDGCVEG
jgi:hypothetical protein